MKKMYTDDLSRDNVTEEYLSWLNLLRPTQTETVYEWIPIRSVVLSGVRRLSLDLSPGSIRMKNLRIKLQTYNKFYIESL